MDRTDLQTVSVVAERSFVFITFFRPNPFKRLMNEIKYFPVIILLARQVHQLFSEKNWKMRTDLAVN